MALKGYHSYRGRRGVWQILMIVLLVLVLLAACAFLFLQRFLTYADDGTYYLDLPAWSFSVGAEKDPETPQQNVNLFIDRPAQETAGKSETEEDERGELYFTAGIPRRLLDFTQLPEEEASLEEAIQAAGANGFVFTAKNAAGEVRFPAVAALPDRVSSDSVSREHLNRLCAKDGLYTVARLNCFRDSAYAMANMEAAGICQESGYIWYDYDLGHWLDPEKEAARRYVIDLALECAQLGFDEIMLEDVCYPSYGKLYKIDYSGNTMGKTEALAQFLTQLREELEPYGVQISLLADETVLNGTAETAADSGFAAQELLPLVDAVYTVTEDIQQLQAELRTMTGENTPVLIPIVSEGTQDGGWYLQSYAMSDISVE